VYILNPIKHFHVLKVMRKCLTTTQVVSVRLDIGFCACTWEALDSNWKTGTGPAFGVPFKGESQTGRKWCPDSEVLTCTMNKNEGNDKSRGQRGLAFWGRWVKEAWSVKMALEGTPMCWDKRSPREVRGELSQ
jgi:hypothetical protein